LLADDQDVGDRHPAGLDWASWFGDFKRQSLAKEAVIF
jgi:hypothetical protein